ncbi:uncharacterized protein [Cicer arietinum]|uniref:Uncharacterized protein LOC101505665 n=1 Tax=Cicer arietinum TaxID=3827 RepID=A0A1S3DXH4_CICAR|nr:uncharacterized protein LOC101505665 [Cicer arietinum]
MLELLVLIVNNRVASAPHSPTQGRLQNLETRVPDLNPMEEFFPSVYDLIVNTPTSNFVDTSSVCLDISIHVYGRDFRVYLVCLSLRLVDVILYMDWLLANRVRVDFFRKTIEFMEPEERDKPSNMSANQVKALLKEDAQLHMILASLKFEEHVVIRNVPIECEFPEVFPKDVNSLPLERDIEFSIDLVPSIGPISMAPYRMSPLELFELKKQLDELLD